MNTTTYEFEAQKREQHGKAHSRRMRRLEDRFPAVIYGANKDAQSISLSHNTIIHAIENEGFYSNILTLNVGGKKEKVVAKAMQRHPSKPKILHMDFLRVRADEKLTMQIPVHLIGADVAPGVKAGGVLSHQMTEVEISCLPADLPEAIQLDVSTLELDAALHLSDLKVPKNVEIVALTLEEPNDAAVVNIYTPKAAAEPEEEEAAAEEGEEEGKAEAEGGDKAKGSEEGSGDKSE